METDGILKKLRPTYISAFPHEIQWLAYCANVYGGINRNNLVI